MYPNVLNAIPRGNAPAGAKISLEMATADPSVMYQSVPDALPTRSAQADAKILLEMVIVDLSAMCQSAQVAILKENAQVDVKITSEMAIVALNVMYPSVPLVSLRHLVPVTLVYKRLTTTFATWSIQTTPVVTRNATVRNQQPHHQRDICLQGQRSTAITSLQKPPTIFPQHHLRILNVVPFVMAKPRVHLDWALLSLTFHSIALKIFHCLIKEQIDKHIL